MKGNSECFSGNNYSFSPLEAQNKDIGAASQTLTLYAPRVTNINFVPTASVCNQEIRLRELIRWSSKGKCFDL